MSNNKLPFHFLPFNKDSIKSTAHCRTRHPSGAPKGKTIESKTEDKTADQAGLAWHNSEEGRFYGLSDAARALACIPNRQEPVYFFADSTDLVRFVGRNESYIPMTDRERALRDFFDQYSILTRDMDVENNHIDLQKGREPPYYFGTFIDLFIAMGAKCIVYGIGKYSYFASKLSSTSCRYSYRLGYRKKEEKSGKVCNSETKFPELSQLLAPV